MISIDKIYILSSSENLEKKKELFTKRIKSIAPAQSSPIEVVDIPKSYDDLIKKNNLNIHREFSNDTKVISLALGHWLVWNTAAKEKLNTILVLEEDFLPTSFHYHILNSSQPWELLYLGRVPYGADMPKEGGLVIPGYSDGSFAYMLNTYGRQKLLASGYDQCMIPTGDFLSSMHGHTSNKFQYLGQIIAIAPMKNFIERDQSWVENVNLINDESYTPLHPQLYAYNPGDTSWLERYLNKQILQKEFDLICDEPIDNVYCFPLFTPLFCQEIIEEAEHYGQWANYRGQDHEPIDMRLSTIGFNAIYSEIMRTYVYPLVCYKYQLRGDAWMKLNSQNFIVRYLADKQGHLGIHNDGSYLSMVVTLNTDFEGGGTYFPKYKRLLKHDQPGYASIHPGLIGYLHGARPVTKGKRYILASFFFPGEKPPIVDGAY